MGAQWQYILNQLCIEYTRLQWYYTNLYIVYCIIYVHNNDDIFQKETELQQASLDASHAAKNLEDEIEKFEKKKLQDIKVESTTMLTEHFMEITPQACTFHIYRNYNLAKAIVI